MNSELKIDKEDLSCANLVLARIQDTKIKSQEEGFKLDFNTIDHDYVINLLKCALIRPLTYYEIKYLEQSIFDGESEL